MTNDLKTALIEAVSEVYVNGYGLPEYEDAIQEVFDAWEAREPEPSAHDAAAVAWRSQGKQWSDNSYWEYTASEPEFHHPEDWIVEPLYTRPAPQPTAHPDSAGWRDAIEAARQYINDERNSDSVWSITRADNIINQIDRAIKQAVSSPGEPK